MKANVPERIYISLIPSISGGHVYATVNKDFPNAVEYTSTDAFIEKAKKWFEEQNEWRDINGIKHCDMESFEDFRKCIEGE
jgi:hypothetical protein